MFAWNTIMWSLANSAKILTEILAAAEKNAKKIKGIIIFATPLHMSFRNLNSPCRSQALYGVA